MKRTLSIILVIALVAALFWVVNPTTPVMAEEYRNGFSITPLRYDPTGIDTDTEFILKTENIYSLEQIDEMLRLLGDASLIITQEKSNEFRITPEKKLKPNSLYTFVITLDNKTTSFTFQTRRDFGVLGTLPANQSSYVPVNTGIELYFTHTGFGKIESYFEITPKVEGRFERNGYAVVFIPKKLEVGTLYTVTVKKGLPLEGTTHKLENDYVFQFETEPDYSGQYENKGSLYFRGMLMEFAAKEAPLIPIDLYAGDRGLTQGIVKTTVYRYKNLDSFVEAVEEKYTQPYWAFHNMQNSELSKKGLTKTLSFEQTFDLTIWQEKVLSLPEALPAGFYLVESTFNDLTAQILIQVTDLSAYFSESETQTIFWVNSLKDGKPVPSASIIPSTAGQAFTTDAFGIALFETKKYNHDEAGNEPFQYYTVKSGSDALVIINNRYRTYWEGDYAQQDYWRYFQTDRSLYKPDDLVQFWGYVQNRYDGKNPEKLTVEIAEGGYWGIPFAKFMYYYLPSVQKPLVAINVPCENGFFEGSFQLPKLSPGGYQITVKSGDKIASSHYIRVENYVKPAYQMTVSKDKNAIFLGETVNFTVTPSFFDGTPLPGLDISYQMGGYPFMELFNTTATGSDGKLVIPFTAQTNDAKAQGEQGLWINVNASLPESGMIYTNDYVRVFINDIHAAFETTPTQDGKIALKAILNKIVLDKLNNPSDDELFNYSDFLGAPVKGKQIAGTIIHHTYEKIEDGEDYDYINKVTVPRYRYEERREKVQSFSFTTDENGTATETFTLKHPNEGFYMAELVWQDGNGRVMNREVYLSYSRGFPTEADYDWFHLEADKEKYRVEDTVVVTLKNNQKPVQPEAVLFIEAQRGILAHKVLSSAEYKTRFTANMIPNFYIRAVYFNGKNYINAGTQNIVYDTGEKKINLFAEADKEAYRPGDTVTLKVTAKDENGKPVAARVNLSLMDEAMLKISHYYVDVLETLYQWLDSGLGYSYSTHGGSSFYGGRAMFSRADGGGDLRSVAEEGMKQAAGSAPMFDMALTMGNVQVRSDFRDTALFRTTSVSKDGTGSVSFQLPDNVTSWKITLAAISSELHGGTGDTSLRVTLPFFINDSINTTYLSGDFPYLGVSGYGNDLNEGETIEYQVTSPQLPGFIATATGKAFERTNIPLWQMEPGVYDIEVKAISETGMSDGVRRTFQVLDTYHEVEKALLQKLTANMSLTGGTEGLTTLIFTDEGRGRLVPVLYGLLYSGGSRLDQKYIAYQANLLLNEIASDRKHSYAPGEVDLTQYQKPDGGFGILPYSESDVYLSALLSPLLKEEAGAQMLKQYFYSLILEQPGRVNAAALYGLAQMGEPILVDLNDALQVKNLPLEDSLFLALAYEALGEVPVAERIYREKVTPLLEEKAPYARVMISKDTDEILKATALTAVLASRLDAPEKDGLLQYITNNYSRKILVSVETLMVALEEHKKLASSDVEFVYAYEGTTYTEHIKDGGGITVTIPSLKLSQLQIIRVTGDASVVSVYKAPLTEKVQPDTNLRVKRTYVDYRTGRETTEFKQNDIVKVVLDWDIQDTAIDSYYEITDYAPSGLKPLENPYQAGIRPDYGSMWWFKNTDGQKVTFNIYRDAKQKEPLVYYARVVSPGTFKADSPIIQGTTVKDSLLLGESAIIKITE